MPRKPVARAVVIVLYDDTYCLETDREGVVVGYTSVAKAIASFEDTYERKQACPQVGWPPTVPPLSPGGSA